MLLLSGGGVRMGCCIGMMLLMRLLLLVCAALSCPYAENPLLIGGSSLDLEVDLRQLGTVCTSHTRAVKHTAIGHR